MVSDLLFGPDPIVWFQQLVGPGHPSFFRALSLLGDTWGLLLVLALSLWLFGLPTVYALIPLAILEGSSFLLLTDLIGIPRPTEAEVWKYETVSMSAFPSGHTYLTTSLWTFLYVRRHVPVAFPILLGCAVGIGRLYLGVHNLGDVLAGLLLGALLGAAYAGVWPRLREVLGRVSFRAYTAVAAAAAFATVVAVPMLGQNPRWWAVGGIVTAGCIALPILQRAVWKSAQASAREATSGSWGRPGAMVAMGIPGFLAALALDRLIYTDVPLANAATSAVAALWVLLLVPLLFLRLARP